MKKLFFTFCMVFLAASFTSQLQAQTKSCSAAQMAACKKNASTASMANCTPTQKAACMKATSTTSKVASTTSNDGSFANYINNSSTQKTASCSSSKSVKLTNNKMPSCTAKKTKVVKNEESSADPIAQKVTMKKVANNE